MSTKTFSAQFLREEILEDDTKIIEDTVVGNSRWSIQHELIFEHEGQTYRTYYQVGATEYQDEGPWEFTPEVQCEEVKRVPKTVMVYEPV